jgi:hypothetical protein
MEGVAQVLRYRLYTQQTFYIIIPFQRKGVKVKAIPVTGRGGP